MKIDVTTGDKITYREIKYNFSLKRNFGDENKRLLRCPYVIKYTK